MSKIAIGETLFLNGTNVSANVIKVHDNNTIDLLWDDGSHSYRVQEWEKKFYFKRPSGVESIL